MGEGLTAQRPLDIPSAGLLSGTQRTPMDLTCLPVECVERPLTWSFVLWWYVFSQKSSTATRNSRDDATADDLSVIGRMHALA